MHIPHLQCNNPLLFILSPCLVVPLSVIDIDKATVENKEEINHANFPLFYVFPLSYVSFVKGYSSSLQ